MIRDMEAHSLLKKKRDFVKDFNLNYLVGDLQERVHKLKTFDRQFEVNFYCDELENQIIMAVESGIKHLNDLQVELLEEIRTYRCSVLSSTKSTGSDHTSFGLLANYRDEDIRRTEQELLTLTAQITEFSQKCEKLLDKETIQSNLDDAHKEAIGIESRNFRRKLKSLEKRRRYQAFNGRFMAFNQNDLFSLQRDHLGRLEIQKEEKTGRLGFFRADIRPRDIVRPSYPSYPYFDIKAVTFLSTDRFAVGLSNCKIVIWKQYQRISLSIRYRKTGSLDNPAQVCSLVVLQNGILASGLQNGLINLWDCSKFILVGKLSNHECVVTSLKVLRDTLVSCSRDGRINIWSLISGDPSLLLTINDSCEQTMPSCFLDLLSNGYLATCSFNQAVGCLRIWNPKDGILARQIETNAGQVSSFLVLHNDRLALGCLDGTVRIFDIVDETANRILKLDDEDYMAVELARLKKGLILVATSANQNYEHGLGVWDVTIGLLVDLPWSRTVYPAFQIWNPESGQLVQKIEFNLAGILTPFAIPPDGRSIVTGNCDKNVHIWSFHH